MSCSVCKEANNCVNTHAMQTCMSTCKFHACKFYKSGSSNAVHNAEAAQVSVRPAETGIDAAGSASAVLLRDIHCSLLRLIQNQGLEKDKKEGKAQPVTAKLFSPDSGGSLPWTAQLAQLILAAPPTIAAAAAKVCLHNLTLCEVDMLAPVMSCKLDATVGFWTCHPAFSPKLGEVKTQAHALWIDTSISL